MSSFARPRNRYVCSIVAFEPDGATGERINVGVIVGNDDVGFETRSVRNVKRARAIDDAGLLADVGAVDLLLGRGDELVEQGVSEMSLGHYAASKGNQMSYAKVLPPTPVIEESLGEALDYCFRTFVRDSTALVAAPARTWVPLRTLYHYRRDYYGKGIIIFTRDKPSRPAYDRWEANPI